MFQKEIQKYLTDHGFGSFVPKVVLFDMDGVLYDSMPNHATAWEQAMKGYGIRMSAREAYATEGMRGVDTIRTLVKQQQNKDIDEAEAQRMYDEKARVFGLLPTAPVMHGVTELMRKIRQKGLQIGIVTGSAQHTLIKRMAHDFKEFVNENCIVTAYDVQQGKPAPEPYLMGLQKAGNLQPWQGIVVENAPMGVRAGVSANIFTIAVNSGPLPDASLTAEGANLLFKKMTDLKEAWDLLAANFDLS